MKKNQRFLTVFIIVIGLISCRLSENNLADHGNELIKWQFQTNSDLISVPVNLGNLIIAQTTNRVYAINALDGHEIWNLKVTGSRKNHPPIEADDLVIIPGNDGRILGIDKLTGIIVWSNQLILGGKVSTNEVVDDIVFDNGTIFIARHNSWLTVVSIKDGNELWKKYSFDRVPLFLFAKDNLVYLAGGNRIISYKMTDGSIVWEDSFDRAIHFMFIDNESIYLSVTNEIENQILSINSKDRNINWFSRFGDNELCCLTLENNKFLISGNGLGSLQLENGKSIWFLEQYSNLGCPIEINQFIFVKQKDNDVYVFDQGGNLIDKIDQKPLSIWNNKWGKNIVQFNELIISYLNNNTIIALDPQKIPNTNKRN